MVLLRLVACCVEGGCWYLGANWPSCWLLLLVPVDAACCCSLCLLLSLAVLRPRYFGQPLLDLTGRGAGLVLGQQVASLICDVSWRLVLLVPGAHQGYLWSLWVVPGAHHQ